jgi:predicted XRE-type DNA-binding protein
MAAKVRRSSGNVFRDLGFPRVEAENLRIRSELMTQLEKLIEREGLTQTAAARLLGVSQPRVSDLVRGRIELFSIDMLVNSSLPGWRGLHNASGRRAPEMP